MSGPSLDGGLEPGGPKNTVLGRLRRAGLLPHKRLGQHFLHDPGILAGIAGAAALGPGDTVLEVGTGPGTLTRFLAARAGQVLTVEVDPEILAFARQELLGLDTIRFFPADALDGKGALNPALVDELRRLGPFKLVANLPYSIATPLLLLLFASGLEVRLAIATVQKEVALRLGAAPGTKEYGPATVVLAFWATLEKIRTLPAGAFWPPPKVTSEVVRITPRPEPLGDPALFPPVQAWAHRLLGHRRKQVGGILRGLLGPGRAVKALGILGLDPQARPDSVTPLGFCALAREFGAPEGVPRAYPD